MTEGKEDPILAAPESGKDVPTPTADAQHADGPISNPVDSTSEDKVKIGLNYDERRLSLLNNPNYGVILCFLNKFRAHVDIGDYPLHLLEENLLSDEENISRRLIDFHLTLLKRISLGKGAKRDKFVSIISKFANRFDYMDGEYLQTNGYSQAQVDIKLRILKNLLETQFDHNPAFKTAFSEKQSFEIRSQTFGRDRSGASYWLFMDSECFIRLFRENYDDDRAWINVAKDKDELEKFIELLITDHLIRKKFPEWKFTHEPFNALTVSNAFEERYVPAPIQVKKEEPKQIKIGKSSLPSLEPIKIENKVQASPKKPFTLTLVKTELPSDHESTTSVDKNGQRSRVASSNETNPVGSSQEEKQEINNNQEDRKTKKSRGRRKSSKRGKKKRRTTSTPAKKTDAEQETLPKPIAKGKKRKQMTDTEEHVPEKEKNDEASQNVHPVPMDEEFLNDDSLPIALRRSRRTRKAPTSELPSVTSTPTKSIPPTPTKKKLPNGKCKPSSQTSAKPSSQASKTKAGRKRGRKRGGAGGKPSMNGMGSSSSDEHQPSEDEDEDEYNSDDYLPDKKQADDLDEEDLLEREEEDDEYVPRRSAKTVAKRRGQMDTEELTIPSSACCVCAKTDRPECLLLCDDCDDAYHLECLKPALISVPDGDWYCPMCEHKRLSENLIEKFIQLIKEYEELEVKRNQCISKRTNRLANVMFNLDRMVKRSTKKRRTNGIVCSDEEDEEEEEEPEEDEEEEKNKSEEDDDDSVYGFQDDGSFDNGARSKRSTTSSKRPARGERQKSSEPETLGVRSCRRKTQNYRFDDYDKKMKEAMLGAGANVDEIDKDSEESEDEVEKKRGDYEKDGDFAASGNKNDDEFAPDQERSDNSESEEADGEEFDDDESSDDGWKSKRRAPAKKKPTSKSKRRKSKNKSDDDDDDDDEEEDETHSDADLDNLPNFDTTKSENTNDLDLNDTGNEDRRRSSRATATKNYAKHNAGDSEDDDDDDEADFTKSGRRPPPRRMRYKKRRGSDDSFVDDDDDYEKIARKREIVKYGKSVSRSSITDHLKKLVDDDDGSAENKDSTLPSEETTNNDNLSAGTKRPNQNCDEPQPSDDDDFPDEQEIFKANGLLSLKKNLNGPPPAGFLPPFAAPTHSYQHAIIDPTARFTMIRPPVRPGNSNGYPSNGHDNLEEK